MSITWKEKVSFQLLINYWVLNMWHQIFFLETLRTSSKHVFKNLSMLGFPRENACCRCKFFFWIWRPKILIFGHTLKFYCLKITDFTYLLFVPNLILHRTNWLSVLNFFLREPMKTLRMIRMCPTIVLTRIKYFPRES